jgi:hypothetical protein
MISKNKLAVVIQGPSCNVIQQKNAWNGFHIVFSTWKGEEDKYKASDNVIFNELPSIPGPANFNFQILSTLNGLLNLKDSGYTHALKIRSDLIPTNANKFIKLLDAESFNFLCWHEHEVYPSCPGYLVDYLCAGSIEDMINLWSITDIFAIVPEVVLTWNYIIKFKYRNVSYFLDSLCDDNDLLWIKNNLLLSSYKQSDKYDKYKKFDFSSSIDSLNEGYLKFL